ncbi:hypothetical protein [Dictyobacter kobayashii]|uniref:hypothetical protein n=1 Tax=Dictyobacter kobayashii TaxID=2014872 RepID=UPI000F818D6E|nr:hypothetical protein [Dictyobacter kobayashii]
MQPPNWNEQNSQPYIPFPQQQQYWQNPQPYAQPPQQQYWQNQPNVINQYYLNPPPDYTWKAFLILFLYMLGYFPGLIINLVVLVAALGTKAQYGKAPGLGCLFLTLITPPSLLILAYLLLRFML